MDLEKGVEGGSLGKGSEKKWLFRAVINASQKPVVSPKGEGFAMLVPAEVLEAVDIRKEEIADAGNQPEKHRETNGTQQKLRNQLPPEL